MEAYSSRKIEVIASCPGPLFDFPRSRSMCGRFGGVTQKRLGDSNAWQQHEEVGASCRIKRLFSSAFLWSSHQLPRQWHPSRQKISQDTLSHWPGSLPIEPMGSSWSMRSSTMRRWEMQVLLMQDFPIKLYVLKGFKLSLALKHLSCSGPKWKKLQNHKNFIQEHWHQGSDPPYFLCVPCACSHGCRLWGIQRPIWVHDKLWWVQPLYSAWQDDITLSTAEADRLWCQSCRVHLWQILQW